MYFRDADETLILSEKPPRLFSLNSGAKPAQNSKHHAGFAPVEFIVGNSNSYFTFDFDVNSKEFTAAGRNDSIQGIHHPPPCPSTTLRCLSPLSTSIPSNFALRSVERWHTKASQCLCTPPADAPKARFRPAMMAPPPPHRPLRRRRCTASALRQWSLYPFVR